MLFFHPFIDLSGHLRKLENCYKFVTSFESHGRELGPREVIDNEGVVHQDSSMKLTEDMKPKHVNFEKGNNENRGCRFNYDSRKSKELPRLLFPASSGSTKVTLKVKYLEMLDNLVKKNIMSHQEREDYMRELKKPSNQLQDRPLDNRYHSTSASK